MTKFGDRTARGGSADTIDHTTKVETGLREVDLLTRSYVKSGDRTARGGSADTTNKTARWIC